MNVEETRFAHCPLDYCSSVQPKVHSSWKWDSSNICNEVLLVEEDSLSVLFHPEWSNGTAGIRSDQPLPSGTSYWEIKVSCRLFGTSLMFGVCTKQARLYETSFTNLIGQDEHGWALSHKGNLWHGGICRRYTRPFPENQPTTVGLLFDSNLGTLSYFKDGVYLGLAFTELHKVKEPLYATISSTAARTKMTLINGHCHFVSLQERCRSLILKSADHKAALINCLPLPMSLQTFLKEPLQSGCLDNGSLPSVNSSLMF